MIYVLPLIGALVITLAMAPTSAAVQTVPYKLNFQGRLAGASGAALTGSYDMQLKLYTAVTGGTYVWGETRTAANANAVTVTNGLFSVMIGEGTAVAGSSASLEAAIATNQTLYLEVIVGAETLTPRNQLGSSAFAMNADKLDGLDSIDLIQNQTASAQAASFRINGSGTVATLNATTTINLGTASTTTGSMVLNNSASANTVTLRAGTTATSYTLTLPTADGNTGDCLKDSNGSGVLAFSSCVSGDSISVNGTAATDANFLDTAATGTTTGVTFTLATAANPDTIALTISNASDTAAGAVTNTTQAFAGAKTFNDSITLAAAKTLNLTGGTTANRPASPTEGMMYYDTTTKQLLTYANGKWQADRSEAVLVAASNSSAADKAAADYLANGNTTTAADGDQVQINQALTAGAGKKVVLLAGTYIADATILIPNNTTLAGVGAGTLIQLADIDVIDNLIENSDTTTGTGVAIQDLRLDGQKSLNTAGTQHGIYLTKVTGGKVKDVLIDSFRTAGLYLNYPTNNIISGNTTSNNGGDGIYSEYGTGNVFADNKSQLNADDGINLSYQTKDSLSSNIIESNTFHGINVRYSALTATGNVIASNNNYGVYIVSSSGNTITGNEVNSNSRGIYLSASNENIISGNDIRSNGSTTLNDAIYLSGSDKNTIVGNQILDNSATTNNYAINISNSTSDTNYIADNRFSSTPGTSTIRDLGTGTVYSNQPLAENGGNITTKSSQDATYVATIQNTSTATTADGLLISLGVANASRTTGNYFVGFAGGTTVAGKIQGGANVVAYTTSGADYAEYFKADPQAMPQSGELVMLDTAHSQTVARTNGNTQKPLAGVVSTSPGFIGNGPICGVDDEDCDANYAKYNALVALSGQVSTKVNTSNGAIAVGDLIMASAVAGEGAKASGAGYIVGYAMEPLAQGSGTIQVLVRPQHHSPSMGEIIQGTDLNLSADANIAGSLNVSGSTNLVGNVVIGTSDDVGTLLVLDEKTGAADPTGTPGAMYYNSGLDKFRCYEGAAWVDCITLVTSVHIVKGTTENVLSSTTLQDDDDLQFTIPAGETWAFEFRLLVLNNGSVGPDWKSAILATGASSCDVTLSGSGPAGAAFPQVSTTDCTTPGELVNPKIVGSTTPFNVYAQGVVTAGASSTTVKLQWAQNTSTATNLSVLGGSYLIAQKTGSIK